MGDLLFPLTGGIQTSARVHQETNIAIRIHSDEGPTLEMSVFESFTVANLPYQPCG